MPRCLSSLQGRALCGALAACFGLPTHASAEATRRDLGTRDISTRDLGTRDLGTRHLGTRDLSAGIAAVERPERARNQRVVLIATADDGPALAQLLEAILQARYPDAHVALTTTQQPPSLLDGPVSDVTLHLDSRDPSRWHLRLWRGEQTWTRTIEGGIEYDAAALEAAALIAGRAILAVIDNPEPTELEQWRADTPASRPAMPTPATASPEPAPASPDNAQLDVAATASPTELLKSNWSLTAYPGASWYTPDEEPRATGSLMAAIHWGPLRVGVGGGGALPLESESELGSFSLSTWMVEARIGYALTSDGFWFCPSASLMLETTTRSDTSPAAGVAATAEESNASTALVPGIELGQALGSHFGVGARATVEFFLDQHDYVAADGTVLLAPSRVRPKAELLASLFY